MRSRVYETDRIEFAEAYLIAYAESTRVGRVASFDQAIGRVDAVQRVEAGLTRARLSVLLDDRGDSLSPEPGNLCELPERCASYMGKPNHVVSNLGFTRCTLSAESDDDQRGSHLSYVFTTMLLHRCTCG